MPRSIVHVLLSLLLLITQQMAMLHVATHLDGTRLLHASAAAEQSAPASAGKPAKPAVQDFCALCLDGAQLAYSLPAPTHGFVTPALTHDSPTGPADIGIHPQPVHVFQPRGPPRA